MNVKLEFEQLQSLAEYQTRLSNLEAEITIASRAQVGANLDLQAILKSKKYNEEILLGLITQVSEKQIKATKLDEDILEKSAQLNHLLTEFKEHSSKMESEKTIHKDREDKVSQKENASILKQNMIAKDQHKLETDLLSFNQKVAKLKEVISTL